MSTPASPNPNPTPSAGELEAMAMLKTMHDAHLSEQAQQQTEAVATREQLMDRANRVTDDAEHQDTTLRGLYEALVIEGDDASQRSYRTIARSQDATMHYLVGKDGESLPVAGFETRRSVLIPFGEINPGAQDGKTHGYAEIFLEEALSPRHKAQGDGPGRNGKTNEETFDRTGIFTGGGIRVYAGEPGIPEPAREGTDSREGLTVITELSAGPVFTPKLREAMTPPEGENDRIHAASKLIYSLKLAEFLASESPDVQDEQKEILRQRDHLLRDDPNDAETRMRATEYCLDIALENFEDRLEMVDDMLEAVLNRAIYDGPLYAPHTETRTDRSDKKKLEKLNRAAMETKDATERLDAQLRQAQEEIGARWAEEIEASSEDTDDEEVDTQNQASDSSQDKQDRRKLERTRSDLQKAQAQKAKEDQKLREAQEEIGARWADDIAYSMLATRSGRKMMHENGRLRIE